MSLGYAWHRWIFSQRDSHFCYYDLRLVHLFFKACRFTSAEEQIYELRVSTFILQHRRALAKDAIEK